MNRMRQPRAGRLCVLVAVAGLVFLAAMVSTPAAAGVVVDSAGRSVTVPDRISRVLAAGPPASALMTILAPEKLAGWIRRPRPEDLDYLPKAVRDLPEIGRLTGRGNTANLETVLAARPDLILDFGTVSDTYVSLADRVQAQTGIPYLLIDGRFDATAAALRLLGPVLGVSPRAEMLAARVEAMFARAAAASAGNKTKPRVYLARRPDGLETGYAGSINTEIIEKAGGINVARGGSMKGIGNVSMEQILVWNPDTVITADPAFANGVRGASGWAGIDAVKTGRVFLSPRVPFGWIDDPPSLNRILGLAWLSRIFHPAAAGPDTGSDIGAEIRELHELLYQITLTDEAAARLLPKAAPQQ